MARRRAAARRPRRARGRGARWQDARHRRHGGGRGSVGSHEVYDPATDSWSEAAPIPTGRSVIVVVALDGRVYVLGGETRRQTVAEAERYHPAAARWEVLPPMPTARRGLGAAAVEGAIYAVAGGPEPGVAFSGANQRLIPAEAR